MKEIAKKNQGKCIVKKECNICMEVDYTAINFRDKQFCNASAQQDRKIAMVLSSAE